MAPRRSSASWAIVLWAVALSLVAVPAASADHGAPLLDDGLATYFGVAQAHWGGPVPSCTLNGVTTLPAHVVLHDDPEPDVAARAEQPGCRIWLDRRHWRQMRRVERCMIVVHEWGHLRGLGHVDAPLDVMAELPLRPPAGCRALAPRSARARASVRGARRCARAARRARRAGGGPRRGRGRAARAQLTACVLRDRS